MVNIHSSLAHKLEREIALLPFEEKLWLIAQIARQIQPVAIPNNEIELSEMANDPEIQREIAIINLEFVPTLMDGLKEWRSSGGQIYFVNLNPVKGREQSGERPVLILSIDAINHQPLVITVVVGTKGENIKRDYKTNVRVSPAESGLLIETVFLCFQIRSLDLNRFIDNPVGTLSAIKMEEIEMSVRYVLGL